MGQGRGPVQFETAAPDGAPRCYLGVAMTSRAGSAGRSLERPDAALTEVMKRGARGSADDVAVMRQLEG
ncbi:MAG TPA: hypothetical protein VGO93_18760 [Candidatus Xenobia bacterium]